MQQVQVWIWTLVGNGAWYGFMFEGKIAFWNIGGLFAPTSVISSMVMPTTAPHIKQRLIVCRMKNKTSDRPTLKQ